MIYMNRPTDYFFPKEHQPGLFRSEPWLKAWLKSWGDHDSIIDKPSRNTEGEGVNLRHVLLKIKVKRRCIPVVRAFPLGISNLDLPSIRSEYFFLPQDEVSPSSYIDAALKSRWDEFFIPDILRSSDLYNAIVKAAHERGLWPITVKTESTYAVDLAHRDFALYVDNLSKSTRLKLYNRRKILNSIGEVSIENVWPQREKFYEILNNFHQKRWGKDCFQGRNLVLINTLLDELSKQDDAVDLSVLKVNGRAVSVVFDIRFNRRQYNIQSGYMEHFDKRISLGTLHFGYQIEKAFASKNIDFYDFMAGSGKHSDYKKNLTNSQDQLISLLLVRNPYMKLAYKAQEQIRKYIK